MPEWITLDEFHRRRETSGSILDATIADTVEIHIEASAEHRDIRIVDSEHVIKVTLDENWKLSRILVDDVDKWQPS